MIRMLDASVINMVMLETTFPRILFPLFFQVKGSQKWRVLRFQRQSEKWWNTDTEGPKCSSLSYSSLICIQFSFTGAGFFTKGNPRPNPDVSLRSHRTAALKIQQPRIDFYTRPPKWSLMFLASRHPCQLQLVHPHQSWLLHLELSTSLFKSRLFQFSPQLCTF